MAKTIFKTTQFQFPYNYRFPGQSSDEKILFLTRENKVMLYLRLLIVFFGSFLIFLSGFFLAGRIVDVFDAVSITMLYSLIQIGSIILAAIFFLIGLWWVKSLWQKSIAIVTNKRLTKFVYSTPASRHTLSLPLEMIVDTGSYTKGFIQTFLQLGTFTARSSATSSGVATDDASRINKKYFYIENIARAEDLQQYINKMLSSFRRNPDSLDKYRPFIPHLKGEARKKFLQENFPEYLKE